jgi:hypothetical protein
MNRTPFCLEKNMKRILCSAAAVILVSTAAFLPTQALAEVGYSVVIANRPPPPRHERIPAARRGYVWAPGYWNWNGNRHRWTKGHWERSRHGHYYQQSKWEQSNEGWRLNRGGWRAGDRDGDGVPNRQDRQPDNPNRN